MFRPKNPRRVSVKNYWVRLSKIGHSTYEAALFRVIVGTVTTRRASLWDPRSPYPFAVYQRVQIHSPDFFLPHSDTHASSSSLQTESPHWRSREVKTGRGDLTARAGAGDTAPDHGGEDLAGARAGVGDAAPGHGGEDPVEP
jgi:hypothetical protein